jgi:hypothetical protein
VIVTLVLIFLGGGLASDVFGLLGLGETAASIWRVARWPAALTTAALIYAIVYYAAPQRGDPALRVHHARRDLRRGPVAPRLGRLLPLRGELRVRRRVRGGSPAW